MNFKELFKIQQKFEDRVGYGKPDKIKKKILSMLIEAAESCGERPSIHKFWSKKQIPNSQKNGYSARHVVEDFFLEELVDVFAFILSTGIDLKIEPQDIRIEPRMINESDHVDLYLTFSQNVLNLYTAWKMDKNMMAKNPYSNLDIVLSYYNKLISSYFELIHAFDYSLKDIEDVYKMKNVLNHERQVQGY